MVGSVPGYHPPITEARDCPKAVRELMLFFPFRSDFGASYFLTPRSCAAGGICSGFVLITKVACTLESHIRMK